MSGSMKRDDRALKLMAYADGELEGAELEEVEKWLAEDADAAIFANDIAELGSLVKMGHKSVKDFDIADAVMAKVSLAPVETSNVVPLKPRAAAPAKKKSTVGWIVAGLALAASVFFVTRSKQEDEAPLARTTSPLVQPAPAQQVAAAVGSGAVEVENPGRSVSVIYVPDEKSTGTTNVTTVVWVDESGGK